MAFMYKEDRSRIKRIGVDILGFLLIIASALTGWLPGPGGIPLLILGLSLLATNHAWAERLLMRFKNGGSKLADTIFNGSRRTKWLIDIIAIVLIALAVYLVTSFTKSIAFTAAFSCTLTGLVLFFGNRKRFHRLKSKVKKS